MPHQFTTTTCIRSARSSLVRLSVATALALTAASSWAREGVEVGEPSLFVDLVPAESVEQAAAQQYNRMLVQARQQNALYPDQDPQVIRLRNIARRIIPYTFEWNSRAKQWRWQVNLVNAKQVNAFCMPGGKILFLSAIIDTLKLTDDEIAVVMGHEVAHALREHARARMGKYATTGLIANVAAQLFGLGNTGEQLVNMGKDLLNLKFSRADEAEADLVGMELAARAGYDPRAGITLWQKMAAASQGTSIEFVSTHPSDSTRIKQIEANLPKVLPLYQRADKPPKS